MPARRAERAGRESLFSAAVEIALMLELVEEHLFMGQNDWIFLADHYN
jgi:hypothetical protein